MTGDEYRKTIQTLGLSQVRAGLWLGVSKRTGQNYATKGPPVPIAKFMRMMIRMGLTAADLR